MSRSKRIGIIAACIVVFIVVIIIVIGPPIGTPRVGLPDEQKSGGTQRITGTVTIAPEAEGKIQVTHSLLHGFSESPYSLAPRIRIEFKNIGNEPLILGGGLYEYGNHYFSVVSKDQEGNTLREFRLANKFTLQPKEVWNYEVDLFSSDETTCYEIIIGITKAREIPGEYVAGVAISWSRFDDLRDAQAKLADEVETKLTITSHRYESQAGSMWPTHRIRVEITNIASDPISAPKYISLSLIATLKNAEGDTVGTSTASVKGFYDEGPFFQPGETKSLVIRLDHFEVQKAEIYELMFSMTGS